MAFKEMDDVESKEQGICKQQEAESGECDSKESKEWR